MAFPFLLLAGALMGKKKQEQEQAEFNRQQEIQAETTRMSPWTGMTAAAPVAPKGKMANMGEGALSGWSFQQGMERADMANADRATQMQRDSTRDAREEEFYQRTGQLPYSSYSRVR